MRCCELCDALGTADCGRKVVLVGIAVGSRDALLCSEHALFALDADVTSLAELRELYEFVQLDEPVEEPAFSRPRARRRPSRDGSAAAASGE